MIISFFRSLFSKVVYLKPRQMRENQPYFELGLPDRLIGGWAKIEVLVHFLESYSSLKLFWDDGSGFQTNNSHSLHRIDRKRFSAVLRLPEKIIALRLHFSGEIDCCMPDSVGIKHLSKLGAIYQILSPHFKKLAKHAFTKRGYFRFYREICLVCRKEGFAPIKELFRLLAKTGDTSLPRKYIYNRFISLTLRGKELTHPDSLKPTSSVPLEQSSLAPNKNPRLIAFYLPQYHPIALNDHHWGKGFTEWRNVAKSLPVYKNHYQPRQPGDLGFYDLRIPEIMEQQASLANEYGVSAFCYYLYWFQGKRLLNLPIDNMLQSKKPDFPFCFCWANENWTRRWDGMSKEIIIAQEHSAQDDINFIRHLFPAFEDPRYVRVNGKPLLLVYRTELFPNPLQTTERWREEVRKAGLNDLYLVRCEGYDCFSNPRDIGFDATYEVPGFSLPDKLLYDDLRGLNVSSNFKGKILDYKKIIQYDCEKEDPSYKRYRDVILAWDNTARHGNNATIFHGVTPKLYEKWLLDCIQHANRRFLGEEKLVFINAWNEWAEGSYLEPDLVYGRSFLEATRSALERVHGSSTPNAPKFRCV